MIWCVKTEVVVFLPDFHRDEQHGLQRNRLIHSSGEIRLRGNCGMFLEVKTNTIPTVRLHFSFKRQHNFVHVLRKGVTLAFVWYFINCGCALEIFLTNQSCYMHVCINLVMSM